MAEDPIVTDSVTPAVSGSPRTGAMTASLAGLAAGVVAIGLATALAAVLERLGLATGTPAPIPAVGGGFVDRTPLWLKNFAVSTFGTADKTALFAGTAMVLALVCVAIGQVTRTRPRAALAAFLTVGVVGVVAVLSRPDASVIDALPTVVGVLAGTWLLGSARASIMADAGLSRRTVLGVGAAAAAGLLVPRSARTASLTAATPLPVLPALAADLTGADLGVAGVTPFVVPSSDFYRIDTALIVPQVDPVDWSLTVTGQVEREVTIDWATLTAKPMTTALVTLTCVSNEVGGDLVGNAMWTGWPVRELLALAGPKPGADMVLSRSVDGWTAGTPLGVLTDERNALLAIAMNGKALPAEHGFPVRLVVPGLYGYVSATKWVTELKVTRFDADEGYWTPRGWAARGPIKTESRVDVPRSGASVTPGASGLVAIAGVAWAQHRGITKVEVQVDDGPWVQARLAGEPSVDAWRQWVYEWPAVGGSHTARVRATDGTGQTQTADQARPDPDGATGWHTVTFTVA